MNEQRLAATLTYRVALSVDEHCGPRLICLVRWSSAFSDRWKHQRLPFVFHLVWS